MIPPFDDNGYLPPGIHSASLDEIDARFGHESELRTAQMQSVRWLIDLARRAGVERLVVNGSFVTDAFEPNDVDCVLLIGPGFPIDTRAQSELLSGLPFLEIDLVGQADFNVMVERFFATDRAAIPKGMVEVLL
jgi:predicted nucleotidyltransferase